MPDQEQSLRGKLILGGAVGINVDVLRHIMGCVRVRSKDGTGS